MAALPAAGGGTIVEFATREAGRGRCRSFSLAVLLMYGVTGLWLGLAPVAAQEIAGRGFDCLIEPRLVVKLGTPVEGLIAEVHVDRGSVVRKGQVLATMESRVEAASVALARARAANDFGIRQSRARLDLARRKLDRMQRLRTTDAVAAATLEEADAEVRVADAELREAELNQQLNKLELARAEELLVQRSIRSPIDGVVTERQLAPGEYRNTQSPVMTIAEIDPLHVEVYLPTALYGRVAPGAIGIVTPEAPVGGEHRASVSVVDRVIDAASGTFGVRLEMPNPGAAIPGGLRCTVRFVEATALRR